jgi:hypothetical protein
MGFKVWLEGVLDKETTDISRTIIYNIKKHEDYIKNMGSTQHFQFTHAIDAGSVSKIQRAANRSSLYVSNWETLSVPSVTGWPNMLIYVSVGEVVHRGYFDRTNNILYLYIQVPKVGETLDYHALIPMLKTVIKHELEHSQQQDAAPFTREIGKQWATADSKAPGDVSFDDPKSVHAYLGHPSEIEAWVAGMYKYAKTAKVPFTQAMNIQLDRLNKSMLRNGVPADSASQVLDDIRNKWLNYQKIRFPQAQLSV